MGVPGDSERRTDGRPQVEPQVEPTVVAWDPVMAGYDFGPTHPLHPVRLELTMDLAMSLGVLDAPGIRISRPTLASDDLIGLIHDPVYLSAVRAAPDPAQARFAALFGLGTADNPIFERMHEAAALITGGTIEAARAVWSGPPRHAVSIAGGLHHAMPGMASGFCIYNDPAIAIAWLLSAGATRVAYVDVDVHHGDGVQTAFYDDPRVLTISLHQTGSTLFPGTGFPTEVGAPAAEGTAVNVALPPATGDAGWLRAFSGVVPVLLRSFRPQVLVTQHGCDTHAFDPLADLALSVDGQRASYDLLHALAHEVCDGRWLACGGGGYALDTVVPRAWTQLLAIAGHVPLDAGRALPEDWRSAAPGRVRAATGQKSVGAAAMPRTLGDGVSVRYRPWDAGEGDPDDPLDRTVAATRRQVLPLHGLDPTVDR
ncbi:acetoin utilization protein AcuC [Frankia sp. B2]|uniref:acetoin utilization protein AcuC n=1 Tax=unclassified Frankia TaxID=2632575 RepID=UPI000460B570|nr:MULTISPECIES: acetoin utilization protein AcuC [unclassified Frankia]KDA43640.1 deacetylase, histone deacetylase/acetoin utilization protein [Frankia sp. BMG5.23]KEZ36948.1 deacetylase, histone deacetylase/acetoin utilization protein [Frankia sp. CeD]TFE27308.1 acetoin utilization protein AcuC [Frankia sp. B2]